MQTLTKSKAPAAVEQPTRALAEFLAALDPEIDRAYPQRWIGRVTVNTRDESGYRVRMAPARRGGRARLHERKPLILSATPEPVVWCASALSRFRCRAAPRLGPRGRVTP